MGVSKPSLEGQMHLSGQLSDWSLNDLLQIMQVTQKTGSLDIGGERHGRIHFRDGWVTGAELSREKEIYPGNDRGSIADILYVLSNMTEGTFSVGPADGPETPGWSVEDVIADVEALRSLEAEIVDAGLFEATGVQFIKEIEQPITIDPEDWSTLMSLVRPFTFLHLEVKLGRGGAVRVFHALHRLGLAETMQGEDESEWLDRLAEELAPGSEEATWLEHVPEEVVELEPTPTESKSETGTETPVATADPPPERIPEANPDVKGVSAPASTTLTDGVYDEIRRLRKKVAEK